MVMVDKKYELYSQLMAELGVNKTTLQSVEALVEAKGTGIEELPAQALKAISDSIKSLI